MIVSYEYNCTLDSGRTTVLRSQHFGAKTKKYAYKEWSHCKDYSAMVYNYYDRLNNVTIHTQCHNILARLKLRYGLQLIMVI